MGDIIALQLEGTDQFRSARTVPRDVAVPGISDALDLGEGSMADRVSLLAAIEKLKRDGLIEERKKFVRDMNGRRNAYFLTDEGRAYVADLRERLADETIVVKDGVEAAIPLAEAGRYLDDPAIPRALSRLTDDGVLYLDADVGEEFVDREAERALLESTLEHVLAGETHVALVAGEAGIGKTTLATDVLAETAREKGLEVLVGNCRRDTDEPYAPFRRALTGTLDPSVFRREGDDPEDARAYEAERTAMFEALVDLIEARADDRPIMLAIDDLHVADEPTVSLFEHLAERLSGPVLLAGTFRPDEYGDGPLSDLRDGDEATDRSLRLDLDRFDRADTRRLIRWVTDHRTIPEPFVDLVYERTGGNPLFVKESVTQMMAEGIVDADHGVFPDDPAEVPLAEDVAAVVDRRLAVLDETTERVLSVGALIGETIPVDLLSAAVDLTEPALYERVDVLVESNVWERTDGDLRFVSGLVRETVVDRLDPDRERECHGRIADAAVGLRTPDRDHHARIAHHYHQAGRYEAAIEHALDAADRATEVYAHELALRNYQRSLSLYRTELGRPEDDERVVDVLRKIADVNYLLGDYDAADRYYQYVTDRLTDPEERRRVYRIRSDMAGSRGDYEAELRLAEAGIERTGIDDSLETCLLLGRKGAGHQDLGDLAAAEEAYSQCLAVARRIDDPEGLAAAYLDFGALDMDRGRVDEETLEMLEDAVTAAEEADGDRVLARALNNLAICHLHLGHVEAAEETYHRCLAVQEAIGDRMALCGSLRNLASIQEENAEYERALETSERAAEIAASVRNHDVLALVALDVAGIYHFRGDLDRALAELEDSLEHARELDDDERIAYTLAYLIDLRLDRGEPDAAADLADELRRRLAAVTDPSYRSMCEAVLGDLRRYRGDLDAAVERYERGLSVEEGGAPPTTTVYNANRLVEAVAEREVPDPELAAEYANLATEAAAETGDEWNVAGASIHRGIAHRLAGNDERAAEAIRTGLEAHRDPAARSVIGEAQALVELARVERERGNDPAAAEYAQAAAELVEDHGIGRYEADLEDLTTARLRQ